MSTITNLTRLFNSVCNRFHYIMLNLFFYRIIQVLRISFVWFIHIFLLNCRILLWLKVIICLKNNIFTVFPCVYQAQYILLLLVVYYFLASCSLIVYQIVCIIHYLRRTIYNIVIFIFTPIALIFIRLHMIIQINLILSIKIGFKISCWVILRSKF